MQHCNSLMLHGGHPPGQSVKLQSAALGIHLRGSGHRVESCMRLSEAHRQGQAVVNKAFILLAA